jgi:hypothetical protein
MGQQSSQTTYTVPPGQDFYFELRTVPPTPRTPALWSTVALVETLYAPPTQTEEVSLVKAWITQLVRKELGPTLDEVDKDKQFDITSKGVDFVQADLITKALMLKAEREIAGFAARQRKA